MSSEPTDPSPWRQNPGDSDRSTTNNFSGRGIQQTGSGSMQINNVNIGNDEDSALLATLRVADPQVDKDRIESLKGGLLGDCYQWVLEHPGFQQWRDSADVRQLWIKGDAGKGKTMLLCGIINQLQKLDSQHHNIIYCFCEATNSAHSHALGVLRSLIFLLLVRQPCLIQHARGEYKQAKGNMCEGQNAWFSLSKIFWNMLQDPALRKTFIIIDALDECEHELDNLLSLVGGIRQRNGAKVLISSRNRPDIEVVLEPAQDEVRISLELNHQAISAAVQTYIHIKVTELARKKRYNETTRDKVLQHFISNADNTFLWVALVSEALSARNVRDWHMKTVLDEFPAGLVQLYARMAEKLFSHADFELCRQVMAIAYSVHRPLSLQELSTLIYAPEGFPNNAESLEIIVSTCQSFLSLRDAVVYFVHQSAKDFVTTRILDRIIPLGLHNQHRLIGLKSLEALDDVLRHNVKELIGQKPSREETSTAIISLLAPLHYACIFWVDHLQDAGRCEDILGDNEAVHMFLKHKLLYWLEALSYLDSTLAGVQAMVRLQDLIALAPKGSSCKSRQMVQESLRFLLTFKTGIKADPLQVYSSALIFSPTDSLVRQTYEAQECPSWILSKPVMQEGWDNCLQTIEAHNGKITTMIFLPPNDQRLASASEDGLIKVWNVSTGACLQTMRRSSSEGAVKSLAALTVDGTRLVSGSNDCNVNIWDTATGMCLKLLQGHSAAVESVASFPGGTQLASGSYDKTARIWDATTGECLHILDVGYAVRCVALSPNGGRLALGIARRDYNVETWDAKTGEYLDTMNHIMKNPHGPMFVMFVPDSAWLLSATPQDSDMWDMATHRCQTVLSKTPHYLITSINLSPDGKRLAYSINRVTYMHSDQHRYVVNGPGNWMSSLAFSSDGAYLASGDENGHIKILSTDTIGHTQRSVHHPLPSEISEPYQRISDKWSFILPPAERDTDWRTSSVYNYTQKKYVYAIAVSPDGTLVASAFWDAVVIWDAATNARIREFEDSRFNQRVPIAMLAFSPDSTCLAISTGSEEIQMRSVTRDDEWHMHGKHSGSSPLAFSPDGRLLASEWQQLVQIYDVATGVCHHKLNHHSRGDRPQVLAFSVDSSHLIFLNGNSYFQIWNMADGTCLSTFNYDIHFTWLPVNRLHIQAESLAFEIRTHIRSTYDKDLIRDSVFPEYGLLQQKYSTITHDPCELDISSDGAWIVNKQERMLWLPSEYRARSFASAGATLALVCESGQILCFRFSLDNYR